MSDPLLLSEVVARNQLVLVVGMNQPWAGRVSADFAELAEIEWVVREAGSGTRSVFEAELSQAVITSPYASRLSCHPTKRCVLRSKQEAARPSYQPRLWHPALKQDCCIRCA